MGQSLEMGVTCSGRILLGLPHASAGGLTLRTPRTHVPSDWVLRALVLALVRKKDYGEVCDY